MRRLMLLSSEVDGDEVFLHYRVTKKADRPCPTS
jgi:hypothetical protein